MRDAYQTIQGQIRDMVEDGKSINSTEVSNLIADQLVLYSGDEPPHADIEAVRNMWKDEEG